MNNGHGMSDQAKVLFDFTMNSPKLHALFIRRSQESIGEILTQSRVQDTETTRHTQNSLPTPRRASEGKDRCALCNSPFDKIKRTQRFCSATCRVKCYSGTKRVSKNNGDTKRVSKSNGVNKRAHTGLSAKIISLLKNNKDGLNTVELKAKVKNLASHPNSVFATLNNLKNKGKAKVKGKKDNINVWVAT